VGTRYEDQPVEQWAGPESLDPTPVWKQYVLVALLLFLGLVLVVVVSIAAVLPMFVTPPAVVPGDRLVLSSSDVPAVGQAPRLVSAPIVDASHAFWLVQPERGQIFAYRARWSERADSDECDVQPAPGRPDIRQFLAANCTAAQGQRGAPLFDLRGASTNGFRGLDRYLLSVSGDRVIVNLSRLIQASERTSGPVPTGIPQPQTLTPP
jgi:hypothetical protein